MYIKEPYSKSRMTKTKEPHHVKETHITAMYVKKPYSTSRIIHTKEPYIIAKRTPQHERAPHCRNLLERALQQEPWGSSKSPGCAAARALYTRFGIFIKAL